MSCKYLQIFVYVKFKYVAETNQNVKKLLDKLRLRKNIKRSVNVSEAVSVIIAPELAGYNKNMRSSNLLRLRLYKTLIIKLKELITYITAPLDAMNT